MPEVDISASLGSLKLRNPFVVGSGPTAKMVEQLKEAEDNQWAAASLKLSIRPAPYINLPPRYRWFGKQKYHIFSAETRLTGDQGLRLVEEAKSALSSMAVIPNITYDGADIEGWGKLAADFENAGADAIELNLCCPNMSYNVSATGGTIEHSTGASMGQSAEATTAAVRATVESCSIPVIAKLTPLGGQIRSVAAAAIAAGAAATGSTANRLGIPDFDIYQGKESIYRLQSENTLGCLSGPWILPLALKDTLEVRQGVGADACVFASGGVSGLKSAVQHIMCGADLLWVCTETMVRGFDWLPGVLEKLREYLAEVGASSLRDIRDTYLENLAPASSLTVQGGYAHVDAERCTACGKCLRIGHCNALETDEEAKAYVVRERCTACSSCVDICPFDAVGMLTASGVPVGGGK
jgi:dihydroorotate dehydrogenase/Pyruvate/2-oxoacid:ferredoxin oxidoreductase delta subunit